MNETPRSPNNTQPPVPVNPKVQHTLDKVNTILAKQGFALRPTVSIVRGSPAIGRYFIKKYSKYLVPGLTLRILPPQPVVSKRKRKKKRKKK